ncbi:hypothetical protein D9M72_388490 [compost metagenome]
MLAGDEPGGQAAGDVEHAQSSDEGRQLETDRDAGVDEAGCHSDKQAHRHGGHRVGAQHLQEIGRGAAGKRKHSPDGEIDIAGSDDIGEPDRDEGKFCVVEQDRERVGEVPPVVGPEGEPRQPQQDGQDDGKRVAAGEKLAEPGSRQRQVARHRSLGLDALEGHAAHLIGGGRRAATQPRPEAARDLAADEVGLYQHGSDEKEAKENQHRARGQGEPGIDRNILAVDDDDARDRPSFAQDLVDQHDDRGPEARA